MLLAFLTAVLQDGFCYALPVWLQLTLFAVAFSISTRMYFRNQIVWLWDLGITMLWGLRYGLAPLCAAVCVAIALYHLVQRANNYGDGKLIPLNFILFSVLLIVIDIAFVSMVYPRLPQDYIQRLLVCAAYMVGGNIHFLPTIGAGDYLFGGWIMLLLNASSFTLIVPFAAAAIIAYHIPPDNILGFIPFLPILVPLQFLWYGLEIYVINPSCHPKRLMRKLLRRW